MLVRVRASTCVSGKGGFGCVRCTAPFLAQLARMFLHRVMCHGPNYLSYIQTCAHTQTRTYRKDFCHSWVWIKMFGSLLGSSLTDNRLNNKFSAVRVHIFTSACFQFEICVLVSLFRLSSYCVCLVFGSTWSESASTFVSLRVGYPVLLCVIKGGREMESWRLGEI